MNTVGWINHLSYPGISRSRPADRGAGSAFQGRQGLIDQRRIDADAPPADQQVRSKILAEFRMALKGQGLALGVVKRAMRGEIRSRKHDGVFRHLHHLILMGDGAGNLRSPRTRQFLPQVMRLNLIFVQADAPTLMRFLDMAAQACAIT